MPAVVAVVERRSDQKLYPIGGFLPRGERVRAIQLAHRARCRDHLSYRQVQKVLADAGIRRSLGQVHADVHGTPGRPGFACHRCHPEAFAL
jgi:hypothetical protein